MTDTNNRRKLADLAKTIRSKNAGTDKITFDIIFREKDTYEMVKRSKALTPESVCRVLNVDPARLTAGAIGVYGEEVFAQHYGQLLPVPAQRVVVAEDGHVVDLAGRSLLCIDTPGHARHHLCVWDARSRSWFTGDTFGLSYRELDSANGPFILPTSSPVQFEPEALQASIARMLAQAPQAMYLTHFGRVEDVPRLAAELHEQVDAMVSLAQACDGGPDRHRELVAALSGYYLERAQAHGCALDDAAILELLEMDIELNAQGLEIWLDRGRRL